MKNFTGIKAEKVVKENKYKKSDDKEKKPEAPVV